MELKELSNEEIARLLRYCANNIGELGCMECYLYDYFGDGTDCNSALMMAAASRLDDTDDEAIEFTLSEEEICDVDSKFRNLDVDAFAKWCNENR